MATSVSSKGCGAASLVGSNWLSELSAPTFSPEVALDHQTSEAGLESQSGTQRATETTEGVLTWAFGAFSAEGIWPWAFAIS